MKNRYLTFLLCFLLAACGSSKKAIEKTEETKKVENEVEVETEVPDSVEIANKREKIEQKEIINERPIVEHETTFEYFNHTIWKELLRSNVSENGKVDYNSFKLESKKLKAYIDSLKVETPSNDWPKEDKLAYWINAYNALTIDLILRNYPVKSIKDIKDPWDQRLWKFGDKWINLNQIEHEILRKMDEPRIHFAIVCASFSCPKLQNKVFTASNLEAQLRDATKEFLADKNRNIISSDKLQLSKIFKWFSKDFKTEGNLIDFLNKYTEIEISSNAKKSFLDYNWDLND